ncbi:hypothetical protein, variant [Aphanomyces invadans]|uniref:Ubiquitin-like domain-containing protein n=1 Tax=Aphanomyces invadans TaxID=157072 RepID=A0A024UA26_9STRA|nr:hypothetical protein, variant [Aphanomyces invadans]ETW02742.1 hypothetical protein, variant [Aphanomyces invadans]|eukprot:XP_008868126.1 hypothetical protein, variant [Aphanomyces invadans]
MRVGQVKALANDAWHSDPGGFDSGDLGSVSVFVQMHRMNDPRERKIKLVMKPWACVKDMKDQLQAMFGIPTAAQQLYYKGTELANARNMVQCGLYADKVVVDLVLSANGRKNRTNLFTIHPYGNHVFPKSIMKAAHLAMQGLALGFTPELAMDGTGGTYFLKDPTQRKVCCFKPQNEEPFGPCNPRGFVGPLGEAGFRKGVLSGEACEREVAAFLMDKDHFASVPATTLAEIKHPAFKYNDGGAVLYKMGSLQEFVRHDDVASDLSPSLFTPHQVHKIVLLDMRVVNTDRNDANLLVRRRRTPDGRAEHDLIPIDHGYSIPDTIEIAWCDWCWYNWPQLKVPLSDEDRQYILNLNVEHEIQNVLTHIPLRPACRRNLRIAGLLVEKGVRKRVLLHDLARIMCREDLDAPSTLEHLCTQAMHHAFDLHVQPPMPSSVKVATTEPAAGHTLPASFASLRINTTTAANTPSDNDQHLLSLTSPVGFWASLDPFDNPRGKSYQGATPMSPAFTSPRNLDPAPCLPTWEQLNQGFHADAKELFHSTSSSFPQSPHHPHATTRDLVLKALPAREEKHFFRWLSHLIDVELDQILDGYAATQ